MPEVITVLLVDHPTLSRRCLAAVLSRRRGLRVVGEAQTGLEALWLARALRPHVAVVETRVTDGGWQLISDLRRDVRGCAVLVLTMGGGQGAAIRALHAGARGYIEKSCQPDDLVHAIQRVHRGELVVAAMPERLKGPGRNVGSHSLTRRELDALGYVAIGHTNQEIAHQLGITEHTAKEHVANILDKLGLENRVQIATYAVLHGLASTTVDHHTGEDGGLGRMRQR